MSPCKTSILGTFFATGGVVMLPPLYRGATPCQGEQLWYIGMHEQASAVLEHALWRLLRARGAAARRRAGARGAGHAVRRISAELLAARGVRARPPRCAAAHPHHERGPGDLPRQARHRGAAPAQLRAPRNLAGIR